MVVNIILDNQKQCFILSAESGSFSDYPRILISLNHLKNVKYQPKEIVIDYIDNPLNEIWNKIDRLFLQNSTFEVTLDEESQNIFKRSKDEEHNFSVFSKKALDVRNNNIDSNELKEFADILSTTAFKRTLMPYQLLASYHLALSQNECNFSVPGSGKTTTVLAAYEYLRKCANENKRVNNLLVIGPLSSFIAWKDEYKECFGVFPKTLEIRGGVKEEQVRKELIQGRVDLDLILISYGSLASKIDTIKQFLSDKKVMVVLDEAHRIKNVDGGVQSTNAMSLAPLASSRVILTGTPAANSYVDLYNLFTFIWPTKNVIGYSIGALNNMSSNPNDGRVSDLINKISPYFIRIKKSDLKLPEPIFHEPILVDMGPVQQAIYDAIVEMAVKRFEDDTLSATFKKSAAIRLRQASSNPSLLKKPLQGLFTYDEDDNDYQEVYDDEIDVDNRIIDLINNYDSLEIPPRLIKLLSLTKSLLDNNQKVIIWCEFIDTCERVSEYLKANGIKNNILYGKTSQEDRETIISAFKDPTNSDFKVVVANPHAVGESISLHKACHNAIYYEMGFNAGVYMQSKDRIHRVGLPKDCETNYYFIQSTDSVDSNIYDRVLTKEEKMIKIIESEEIPLISNNIEFENDPDEDDIKLIIKSYYERRKNL
ncbi:MAG: DEAD/DEAH box helicase [Bacilli bacterium]|nr:DEAD/DEAH box helicase [Bacilli bacterium]